MHEKVLRNQNKDESDDEPAVLSYTEREKVLLDYLASHGGITLGGFTRLAHISREAAEQIVVKLCQMNVVTLEYLKNGTCLIVL